MGQEADCIALGNHTSQQFESILWRSLGCGFLKTHKRNLYCSQEATNLAAGSTCPPPGCGQFKGTKKPSPEDG